MKIGRGGGIRTPDPLLPKQMRYQTALRPDNAFLWLNGEFSFDCIATALSTVPYRRSICASRPYNTERLGGTITDQDANLSIELWPTRSK